MRSCPPGVPYHSCLLPLVLCETTSFNYGQDGVLSKQQNVMCRATGAVKRQIITVAQRAALQLAPAKTSDQ